MRSRCLFYRDKEGGDGREGARVVGPGQSVRCTCTRARDGGEEVIGCLYRRGGGGAKPLNDTSTVNCSTRSEP
jgi:hypothetical protein